MKSINFISAMIETDKEGRHIYFNGHGTPLYRQPKTFKCVLTKVMGRYRVDIGNRVAVYPDLASALCIIAGHIMFGI